MNLNHNPAYVPAPSGVRQEPGDEGTSFYIKYKIMNANPPYIPALSDVRQEPGDVGMPFFVNINASPPYFRGAIRQEPGNVGTSFYIKYERQPTLCPDAI